MKEASAQVAPPPESAAITFGSRVTLTRNGKTQSFRIVGEDEADPVRGLVSWRSPLAQAVMGAEVGDEIEMEKPKGEIAIPTCHPRPSDPTGSRGDRLR